MHIFVHKSWPYHFEVKGEDDFMSKYFFSGGTMPSLDLLGRYQRDLALQRTWRVFFLGGEGSAGGGEEGRGHAGCAARPPPPPLSPRRR